MAKTNIGMIRVAAASPVLKVGNPEFNSGEILSCTEKAYAQGAGIIVFPELCLTGASCGDLFFQDVLYKSQKNVLNEIALTTKKMNAALVLGTYLRIDNFLAECAILLQNGLIKGIVPKYSSGGMDGQRRAGRFSSGAEIERIRDTVTLFDCEIPFGRIIFQDPESGVTIGIETGEDLSAPVSPGAKLCLAGAQIICNTAASPALIGSVSRRRYSVLQKSRDCLCGYVYASAGVSESTASGVYSGHCMAAESGVLLKENCALSFESKLVISDIDYERIISERTGAPGSVNLASPASYRSVDLRPLPILKYDSPLHRNYSKTPFIPNNPASVKENCREAFEIQSAALARRLSHTKSKKAVLGISGGLDSTLALLVAVQAMKTLERPSKDVITVTMPGFGTTDKTYSNAMAMMEALRTEIRQIPINEAVLIHFRDIAHDPEVKNTVYENVQARERTQILMDLANMEGGIQVGTGDLSEAALGWNTYNGDHMSMYNVNAGIPKTVIRTMLRWFVDCILTGPDQDPSFCSDNKKLATAVTGVLDTPVSPELLPPDESGGIAQKTEDQVGPYVLHDFFLYHTVRFGTSPAKLLAIAKKTFADDYAEDIIKNWLNVFYRRFFAFQFKRACAPDSPKVGTVSLSPGSDWQMPSDANADIWL